MKPPTNRPMTPPPKPPLIKPTTPPTNEQNPPIASTREPALGDLCVHSGGDGRGHRYVFPYAILQIVKDQGQNTLSPCAGILAAHVSDGQVFCRTPPVKRSQTQSRARPDASRGAPNRFRWPGIPAAVFGSGVKAANGPLSLCFAHSFLNPACPRLATQSDRAFPSRPPRSRCRRAASARSASAARAGRGLRSTDR